MYVYVCTRSLEFITLARNESSGIYGNNFGLVSSGGLSNFRSPNNFSLSERQI